MGDSWQMLEQECRNCHECALCKTRKNVVFGVGNPHAEILLVGEGPGANEDEQGIPFVGRAGQLLDDMLALIGLDRTKVYIANIVKCRPPGNRDPLHVEQDACIGYLNRQIALISPKIVICLGRIAAMRLIDAKFKITREHGQWFERSGMRVMALYHPAALLRDVNRLPETFDDLKEIQREILCCCEHTELNDPWRRMSDFQKSDT
ncbi:MAG: uracil-DNA glycosylase [Oscillospiraceae bacterium]|nr:uracil-DNA glycosylase [Oscillospiraceae bacterium]